jgi:CheY-like chemotaxis protein
MISATARLHASPDPFDASKNTPRARHGGLRSVSEQERQTRFGFHRQLGYYRQHAILKLLCLLFLFIFAPSSLQAAPVLVLDSHSPAIEALPYIDLLLDEQQYEAKQIILGPENKRFAPSQSPILSTPSNNATLWLRFAIHNNGPQSLTRWLKISPQGPERLQLYSRNGEDIDNASSAITNITSAITNNGAYHLPGIYQLLIPPQQTRIYYLQLQGSQVKQLALAISPPETLVDELISQSRWFDIGLGALFMLTMVNWLISAFSRDQVLLVHSLYLFGVCGVLVTLSNYLSPLFASGSNWQSPALSSFLFITGSAIILLSERLLKQHRIKPSLRLFFRVCLLINSLIYFYSMIISEQQPLLVMIAILASVLFTGIALKLYFEVQDKLALSLAISKAAIGTLMIFVYSANSTGMLGLDSSATASLLIVEALSNTIIILLRTIYIFRQKAERTQLIAVAEAEAHSQGEILNRISHDIRTPISGVMGMSELLLDTPLTANQRDHVETIQSSGQALLNLINETLDHSRIDLGKVDIKHSSFEVSNLVNECTDGFRSHAEEKNIELISDIASDVPAMVKGDAARIRQILFHLLSNAFKNTDNGEIVLTAKADQRHPNHILFAVRDTGRGLNSQEKEQLLSNDFALSSLSPPSQSGISLAIVYQLIQRMQGEAGINSAAGEGAEFWFSLPLPSQSLSAETEHDVEKVLRQKRMLIVDDNETCRKLIQQQGTSWGMHVSSAQNGNEAYALLRAKQNLNEQFDIILVDHNMPGMSGMQLAAKISEDSLLNPKPLLIMLTGLSQGPIANRARELGIRRILTKPVTGKALKISLAEELNYQQDKRPDNEHKSLKYLDQELIDAKVNILVAEDNLVSQKVIVSMLRKLGAECKTVGNGLQAFEALQRGGFDMVLMDCEMPIMDGFQATREIRQWETSHERGSTPIIALTAHIMDEHKEKSLASGMNAHLAKPVELSQLQHTLRRWALAKRVS